MEWQKQYEVGDAELDQEHRALFEVVSILEERAAKATSPPELKALLARLISYLRAHFRVEERRMREAHFPDTQEHADEHTAFLQLLEGLEKESLDVNRSAEVIGAASGWVKDHTLGSDHKLAHYLRATAHSNLKTNPSSA